MTPERPPIPAPDVVTPFAPLRAEVHATGMNPTLARPPRCEAAAVSLRPAAETGDRWRPKAPPVRTVKLMFPEAVPLLEPPKPKPVSEKPRNPSGKRTRLKPPTNALALSDRLFYLLQPPLEELLAGQDLAMPFEPFPYQYQGIAWLFSHDSALLADEMGLGKTMQTITAIRLLLRSGQVRRVLLICPKPLIPNWQREFAFWAEEIPVHTIEGDWSKRKIAWTQPGVPVLLTNYEKITRDWVDLGPPPKPDGSPSDEPDDRPKFDLVVLDEAQRIKNGESVTAKVIKSVGRGRSWALTGTPIENRPDELVNLYRFLGPLGNDEDADLSRLRTISESHILRRSKDLVHPDMPPRLDRTEYLELAPGQQTAYQTAETEGVVRLREQGDDVTVSGAMELVMRLKQIANFDPLTDQSCKLDALCSDMEEIAASGGKAILFSQWTKTLDWIDGHLRAKVPQSNPLIYHGGVPHKQREPILAEFKERDDRHIILMSYGTGAVGLNLQFAGYVFLYDRWWNPAIEDQAINRAHRVGVKNKVVVTKYICTDTVEERINKVLQEKRDIFQAVLGEADSEKETLGWQAKDIFALFDLNVPGKAELDGPLRLAA